MTTSKISDREIEVMMWISRGKSTWDIATILQIAESTVKFHTENLMKKLVAVNRAHAVSIAYSKGILSVASSAGDNK